MTLGKVDKEMIDKLKADRRQRMCNDIFRCRNIFFFFKKKEIKLIFFFSLDSHYRWSSIINEVPREVELYRVDGNFYIYNCSFD